MELTRLLHEARSATLDRRIEWRDPIASFGERAIIVMEPWLADPVLASFAIRVIERAGERGEGDRARRVLRSARRIAPPRLQSDLDWALGRLRPVKHPSPAKERAATLDSGSQSSERRWHPVVARSPSRGGP
jgi:hypothetical protein